MELERRTKKYEAERLLQLHDELDDLVAGSGLRHMVRTTALAAVAAFVGFGVFQLAVDVGAGVEMGLVFVVSASVAAAIQVLKRLRVRELRRQIAEVEQAGDGEISQPEEA